MHAAESTAEPPRLWPWAPMRAASMSACSTRTAAAASTSQALAAKEYCAWLATVEVTPRGPNGSITQQAIPASVSRSPLATCDGATPRLPGTTMTTGHGPSPGGRNRLPRISVGGMESGSEIAWWKPVGSAVGIRSVSPATPFPRTTGPSVRLTVALLLVGT